MKIMNDKLSVEDIICIRKARTDSISMLIFLTFIVPIGWELSLYFGSNELNEINPVLKYVFYILPFSLVFKGVYKLLSFSLDIRNGQKIVLISVCKKRVEDGDGGPYEYLVIEGYGELYFAGFNSEVYGLIFLDKAETYEIHLAPRSKVILFAKRLSCNTLPINPK